MQCRSSKKWVMVFAWRVVYARFHTNRHRCCRDMHFNSRLDIKFGQIQWSMKYRSSAPCHSKWFLSVSRAIAIAIYTPTYHCCREMHFISRLDIKFWQSWWSVKCRSRVPGHGAWLLRVSRTINIQGIILPDITAAEICTLFLDSK